MAPLSEILNTPLSSPTEDVTNIVSYTRRIAML